jgi:O-antigen ligase
LTEYSKSIPTELNHFHNNLIQVAVENGWLGLTIFCWWILSILKLALSAKGSWEKILLARTFGCAIMAWQIAGLVEYNFGDSQVLFAVFVVMGLLAANNEIGDQAQPREKLNS